MIRIDVNTNPFLKLKSQCPRLSKQCLLHFSNCLEMPNWALNALNAFRTRFCCWDAFSIGPPSHHTCGTHFDVPRTPSASLNKFSQSVDASDPTPKGCECYHIPWVLGPLLLPDEDGCAYGDCKCPWMHLTQHARDVNVITSLGCWAHFYSQTKMGVLMVIASVHSQTKMVCLW